MRKGSTFHSLGQTPNSLDWEIVGAKISKRHAVAFKIDYFIFVNGRGEGLLRKVARRGQFQMCFVFNQEMGKLYSLFRVEPVPRKEGEGR